MVGFLCINCSKDVRESYGSRDGRMVLPPQLDSSKVFLSGAVSALLSVPVLHHPVDRFGAGGDCRDFPSSRCGGHLAGPRVCLLAKDSSSGKFLESRVSQDLCRLTEENAWGIHSTARRDGRPRITFMAKCRSACLSQR